MDPHINISVKNQEGSKLFFRIKRDYQLKKLLTAYCKRTFLTFETVQFLINGQRFDYNLTPNEAGLKDGDEIDAMLHSNGGGDRSV